MIKCPSCNYESDKRNWTLLELTSSDGYASIIGKVYDTNTQDRRHVGRVELYACPECKTVTFD